MTFMMFLFLYSPPPLPGFVKSALLSPALLSLRVEMDASSIHLVLRTAVHHLVCTTPFPYMGPGGGTRVLCTSWTCGLREGG